MDLNLRDQFALAALQGLLAAEKSTASENLRTKLAQRAYEVANAMLEARHDVKLPERFAGSKRVAL